MIVDRHRLVKMVSIHDDQPVALAGRALNERVQKPPWKGASDTQ